MISNEVKAKFFAMYLRQTVFKDSSTGTYFLDENSLSQMVNITGGYLLLRDISGLTDDEYFDIAILCGYVKNKFFYNEMVDNGHVMIAAYQEDFHISIMCYDYLRSIGILLPFTYLDNGKPITLTPARLIELGWAKIETNENHN